MQVAAHRVKLLFGLAQLPAAAELHGNMSQTARLEALDDFRKVCCSMTEIHRAIVAQKVESEEARNQTSTAALSRASVELMLVHRERWRFCSPLTLQHVD